MSADVQQRRNPKTKEARIFDNSNVLEGIETQDDTRDGTDYSFNADIATKLGAGTWRLSGFYVQTDRTEEEFTQAFEVDGGARKLDEVATQLEDIKQHNANIVSEYTAPVGNGEIQVLGGYNVFVDDLFTTEREGDTAKELALDNTERIDTTDQDYFATLAYTARFTSFASVKFGVDGRIKTRDFEQLILNSDGEDETPPNGVFDIEERRVDPFIKATWNFLPGVSLETGLRYEHTDRELSGPDGLRGTSTADELNPSAHLRYSLTDTTIMRLSLARTVRRPSFDQLSPATVEDEPVDDKATLGNPDLQQETAWGVDAGFDQKIGERGILGFNFFNREIKDKIELVGTGAETPGCDSGTCDVLSFRNVGDARAYGIEVDADMPLTAVGLPNTTVFANYTWLQSEVTDPVTGRKHEFNGQPEHIYNVGFIQAIPSWNSAFGVSYQKRGESFTHDFNEIERLTYEGNLEAFWETRLGKSTVLRFTGANLLDAEKVEYKQAFDPDLNGGKDGSEIEKEESGRLFLMTVRQAF